MRGNQNGNLAINCLTRGWRYFVLLIAVLVGFSVQAAEDPNYVYVYKANWWQYAGGSCSYASMGQTASCVAGSAPSYEITGSSDWSATLFICYYANCGGGGSNRILEGVCAPGWESTSVDGKQACRKKASCKFPLVDDGNGGCKDSCESNAGKTHSSGLYKVGNLAAHKAFTPVACSGSCTVAFSGGTYRQALVNGVINIWYKGSYTYLGYACAEGEKDTMSSSGSVPSDTCAANQDTATMNGVTKCYDRATGKPTDPKTGQPTDNPPTDKSKSSETTTTTGEDGTKTTTTVECGSNGCTTKTTTDKPDGSSTTVITGPTSGESSGDEEQPGFCAENPDSPICKESSFSGSCDSAFTCEGDAAQCATAKAANELKCAIKGEPNATSQLGDAMMAGTDSYSDMSGITSTVNAGAIDKSAWLTAACIQDRTVDVMGKQIVLPFSKVCPWLQILGVALQVISSIVAIRIVLGGIQ